MSKRVIPKEWKCVSGTFKGLHYMLYILVCVFAVCAGAIVVFSLDIVLATSYDWFMLILRVVGVVIIFYYLCIGRKANANLKKVIFLPNYIYIDKYRIPYHQVQSIELSEVLETSRWSIFWERKNPPVVGFSFKLELKTNTQAGKTILFVMDFSTSPFVLQNDYDYQKNFIDVVMQWAHDDVKPPSQYAF